QIVGFGDPAKIATSKTVAAKAKDKAQDKTQDKAKVEDKKTSSGTAAAQPAQDVPVAVPAAMGGTALIGGLVIATTAKKLHNLFKRS
ncbi:hypothetical protein, partial [Bailinhaonella thermotolerans]